MRSVDCVRQVKLSLVWVCRIGPQMSADHVNKSDFELNHSVLLIEQANVGTSKCQSSQKVTKFEEFYYGIYQRYQPNESLKSFLDTKG